LLTEPPFVEEVDTLVDEITDQYVRGEIQGDERKYVERYFLKARERKRKARFASALLEHAAATRNSAEATPVTTQPLIERLLELFAPRSVAFKFAIAALALVLIAGIAFVAFRDGARLDKFQAIELSITSSDRGIATQPKSLQLAPEADGARIILKLPDQAEPYQSYRVELVTRDGMSTPLEVTQQDARTVTAIAPASLLHRGTHGIELAGIKADGNPERMRGTYYFRVE
jgi:hypothetical protein